MLAQFFSRHVGNLLFLVGLLICAFTIIIGLTGGLHAQPENMGTGENQAEYASANSDATTNPWWGGDWQIGIGAQTGINPYHGADSMSSGWLPILAYDAERLHIGTDGVDVKVWHNRFVSISALGALRGTPFDPDDSDYLRGLEKRHMAVEAGVGTTLNLWRGELRADYLTDLNDAYGRHEVDVAYYLPTEYEKFSFNVGGGVTWQSEDLVDYNVGVRRNEVRSDRGFYSPDATFIPHLDFSVTYPVTESFAVVGTTDVKFLLDEYTDSPIIDEDYVLSAGLVLVYTF